MKKYIILIVTIVGFAILIGLGSRYILPSTNCGDTPRSIIYDNLKDAEKELGKIKLPKLSYNYKISKIVYENDGFTTPKTIVYFNNDENKKIIFMITSNYSSVFVKFQRLSGYDTTWITNHSLKFDGFEDSYIIMWRKSNQENYKYLITNDINDKDWFTKLARLINT